ncbi:MAG: hypothetical protein JXB88_07105 [Spirochaetales bacterium]|nr:hypothetical protein [Spirochaetales bacterium]
MKTKTYITIIVIVFLTFFTNPGYTIENNEPKDLNQYYRFPLSFGIEYETLSPFNDYGAWYNVYEISVNVRYPLPFLPTLQPSIQGGIIQFDNKQEEENKWDNYHIFGTAGLVFSRRFARYFELGGDLVFGMTQSYFPYLLEDATCGGKNLIGQAGIRICLNPSYNFLIDIHPNIKYLYSLSELKDFNGLIFSLGFTAHYRLGRDPDMIKDLIKSIKIENINFPGQLFAAMQHYYTQNPLTIIIIINTEKYSIFDVEVSFFQPQYMDSPTPSFSIEEIKGNESIGIPVFATFNNNVFTIEGVIPLTGEIIISYISNQKHAEQKKSVSFSMYDKRSIVWDNEEKIAAFITPEDSALCNYAVHLSKMFKDIKQPAYSDSLQTAMEVYYGLAELGCFYQPDPKRPLASVKNDVTVIDSVSLPRETLLKTAGDCDDLTVLYLSILQAAGVETGFITLPDHIYPVVNTKIPLKNYKKVHPEKNMTLSSNNELWVPVEITLLGKEDFLTAWKKGIEEYYLNSGKAHFYTTKDAHNRFRPVSLKEEDLGLQYGAAHNIINSFTKDMDKLKDAIIRYYRDTTESSGQKEDYNLLGIVCGEWDMYENAENAFMKALEIDPDYYDVQINHGVIYYSKGEYQKAVDYFLIVMEQVLVNEGETSPYYKLLAGYIADLYIKLGDNEKAAKYSMIAKGNLLPDNEEDPETIEREKADVQDTEIIHFIHNGRQ